jgi:hypothetical protein
LILLLLLVVIVIIEIRKQLQPLLGNKYLELLIELGSALPIRSGSHTPNETKYKQISEYLF